MLTPNVPNLRSVMCVQGKGRSTAEIYSIFSQVCRENVASNRYFAQELYMRMVNRTHTKFKDEQLRFNR